MKRLADFIWPKSQEGKTLFISTLAIILVNGAALLYCKLADSNKDAERYYKTFEPIKYYVFLFCYSILAISFAFNVRLLFSKFMSGIQEKAVHHIKLKLKRH